MIMLCTSIQVPGLSFGEKKMAPEGAVTEIVLVAENVTGLSNFLSLLGLADRNVNCDVHVGGGGHDNNRRGRHSMLLCKNGGDACLRL